MSVLYIPCRIIGSLNCVCGSNLAQDQPATDAITLVRNNTYLRFTQSTEGNLPPATFESLLNDNIAFHHGLVRPDLAEPYDVYVTVSINDGMFMSNTATATITVQVDNTSPTVLLDGIVSVCHVASMYRMYSNFCHSNYLSPSTILFFMPLFAKIDENCEI